MESSSTAISNQDRKGVGRTKIEEMMHDQRVVSTVVKCSAICLGVLGVLTACLGVWMTDPSAPNIEGISVIGYGLSLLTLGAVGALF